MSQQRPARRGAAAEPARPDASMSLLTAVMNRTLDEGYVEAAARRSAGDQSGPPPAVRVRLWLAAGLALAALVVTLGAAQARVAVPTVAREQVELTERIETATMRLDLLHTEVEQLSDAVAARRRAALREEASPGDLVALLAGATEVEGPGTELIVDDAEGAGQDTGTGPREGSGFSNTGRVRDRDLQRVVNGLWQAGAEALSVNGRRLTSVSAIRAAGDAILVDNRPLVPPYTLIAIGGDELDADFEGTVDGQYLLVLRDKYGIRFSSSRKDRVRVPAAPSLTVRMAEPLDEGKGSAS